MINFTKKRTGSMKVEIKFTYLSCFFSAIIVGQLARNNNNNNNNNNNSFFTFPFLYNITMFSIFRKREEKLDSY